MIHQPPLQSSDQSFQSSTSSYSQIIPREQTIFTVRKDKPIVIKSIPINKQRLSTGLNHKQNSYKTLSDTNLFQSKNLSTKVQSFIPENQHNQNENIKSQSQKSIKLSENGHFQDEIIQQQNYTPKPTSQVNIKQNEQIEPQSLFKQFQTQRQKNQPDIAILNYSMSSFTSQKPLEMTPRQSFQWNSNKKNQSEQKLNKVQKQTQQRLNEDINILMRKNQQLQSRFKQLQDTLKNESQNFDLQRKANEIYTEFYYSLSKIITQFIKMNKSSIQQLNQSQQSNEPLNGSMNMQKITQTVTKLIQSFSNSLTKSQTFQKYMQTEIFPFQQIISKENQSHQIYIQKISHLQKLIEEVNEKNNKLKGQLLQSTQNNINAIFNTEISASCCLQNEVKKINNQMSGIKDKINLLLLNQNNKNHIQYQYSPQPQPQIIYLTQPNIQPNPIYQKRQPSKIVKIYTTKAKDNIYESSESDEGYEQRQKSKNKKRQHSLSRKRKRNSSSKSQKSPSSSSISSKQTKKREEMSRKQIQHLKQAYNQTKNELNALINTFSMINNSQTEMKTYFKQIKEDFLRQMNEKLARVKQQNLIQKTNKEKLQLQAIRQQSRQQTERKLQRRFEQLLKQKQSSYQFQLDNIQKQRANDKQLIFTLNNKVSQLTSRTSVPERVTQQKLHKKVTMQLIEQQIPTSDISISVDWLRMIEQLRKQNTKQKSDIESLIKSNDFLKQQIQNITIIKNESRSNRNIYQQASRGRKDSIINQLNGFSQASVYPTLPMRTNENFQLRKNKFYTLNKNSQQSLQYLQSNVVVNHSSNIKKLQLSRNNLIHSQPLKNHQTNFKVILQSKQTHIKNLQREVLNLQQTVQYLKQQVSSRQRTIEELENYIINLENQSVNSHSLSHHQQQQQQINSTQPQINVYVDQNNNNVDNVRNKYENYVKNLKMLLKQSKNQNKLLKQQLQNLSKQPDQLTQSNFVLKNSTAHSQRTTKNFPNSTSPTHPKSQADILGRKKYQRHENYQNQRQQQRINSLANQRDLFD